MPAELIPLTSDTMTSVPPESVPISLPESKSMLARKLCIDFISGKHIHIADDCDDIRYLSRALATMEDSATCKVHAGESATAMRFLTAIAAARPETVTVIDAAPQLRKRPIAPLTDALRSLGAYIEYLETDGHAPLLICGRRLAGGTVDFTGTGSSQYASACMLISSMTTNGIKVIKNDIASLPYLEMTRQMLIDPHAAIEPDWSAASYFYEWVALTGQAILLRRLLPYGRSLQGDARTMDIFRTLFDVRTVQQPEGLYIYRGCGPETSDIRISLTDCPDLAPALAMTMAMTGKKGELTGLNALRIKESDRLESLSAAISALGGRVAIVRRGTDWQLHIPGAPEPLYQGSEIIVDSYEDHRIAMCVMAATQAPHLKPVAVTIKGYGCIAKSFPRFHDCITNLRKSICSCS